jgi:hypothetical protein
MTSEKVKKIMDPESEGERRSLNILSFWTPIYCQAASACNGAQRSEKNKKEILI